ncbi:MAG: hypothetical protein DRG20_05440 [Deltaproteobacteria bacterium]|nr:MAG: hypothetical protein DRG20_05440 [Deltaproteobacteria bacterium]
MIIICMTILKGGIFIMKVKYWMIENPITVTPETPIFDLRKMFKEKAIRRFPVVENKKVVGIVTLTDYLRFAPSQATTLSIHELEYLLINEKVKKIMTKKPHKIYPDTSIELAAKMMRDYHVGGLPVVEKDDTLVGFLTESKLFDAFMEVMGMREKGGDRITFVLENKPSMLADLLNELRSFNAKIISIVTTRAINPETKEIDSTKRIVSIVLDTTTNLEEVIKSLKEKGYYIE